MLLKSIVVTFLLFFGAVCTAQTDVKTDLMFYQLLLKAQYQHQIIEQYHRDQKRKKDEQSTKDAKIRRMRNVK